MVHPAFIIFPIVSVSVFIAIFVLNIICMRRAYNSNINIRGRIYNGRGQVDVVVINDRNNTGTSTFAGDGTVDAGGDSGFNGNNGWGYDAGGGVGNGFGGGGGYDGGGGGGFSGGGGGGCDTGGGGGGGGSTTY